MHLGFCFLAPDHGAEPTAYILQVIQYAFTLLIFYTTRQSHAKHLYVLYIFA